MTFKFNNGASCIPLLTLGIILSMIISMQINNTGVVSAAYTPFTDNFNDTVMDPVWNKYEDEGTSIAETGSSLDFTYSGGGTSSWYYGYYYKYISPNDLSSISLTFDYSYQAASLGDIFLIGHSTLTGFDVFEAGFTDHWGANSKDKGMLKIMSYTQDGISTTPIFSQLMPTYETSIVVSIEILSSYEMIITVDSNNGVSITSTFYFPSFDQIRLVGKAYGSNYKSPQLMSFQQYSENGAPIPQIPTATVLPSNYHYSDSFDSSLVRPEWTPYTDPGISLIQDGSGTLDLSYSGSSTASWYGGYYSKDIDTSKVQSVSLMVNYNIAAGNFGKIGLMGYSSQSTSTVFILSLIDGWSGSGKDQGKIGIQSFDELGNIIDDKSSGILPTYSGTIYFQFNFLSQDDHSTLIIKAVHSNFPEMVTSLTVLDFDQIRIYGEIVGSDYSSSQVMQFENYAENPDVPYGVMTQLSDDFTTGGLDQMWTRSYGDPGMHLDETGNGYVDISFDGNYVSSWFEGYYTKSIVSNSLDSVSGTFNYDIPVGNLGELGIMGYSNLNQNPTFFAGLYDHWGYNSKGNGRLQIYTYNELGSIVEDHYSSYLTPTSGGIIVSISTIGNNQYQIQVNHSDGTTLTIPLTFLETDEIRLYSRIYGSNYNPSQLLNFESYQENMFGTQGFTDYFDGAELDPAWTKSFDTDMSMDENRHSTLDLSYTGIDDSQWHSAKIQRAIDFDVTKAIITDIKMDIPVQNFGEFGVIGYSSITSEESFYVGLYDHTTTSSVSDPSIIIQRYTSSGNSEVIDSVRATNGMENTNVNGHGRIILYPLSTTQVQIYCVWYIRMLGEDMPFYLSKIVDVSNFDSIALAGKVFSSQYTSDQVMQFTEYQEVLYPHSGLFTDKFDDMTIDSTWEVEKVGPQSVDLTLNEISTGKLDFSYNGLIDPQTSGTAFARLGKMIDPSVKKIEFTGYYDNTGQDYGDSGDIYILGYNSLTGHVAFSMGLLGRDQNIIFATAYDEYSNAITQPTGRHFAYPGYINFESRLSIELTIDSTSVLNYRIVDQHSGTEISNRLFNQVYFDQIKLVGGFDPSRYDPGMVLQFNSYKELPYATDEYFSDNFDDGIVSSRWTKNLIFDGYNFIEDQSSLQMSSDVTGGGHFLFVEKPVDLSLNTIQLDLTYNLSINYSGETGLRGYSHKYDTPSFFAGFSRMDTGNYGDLVFITYNTDGSTAVTESVPISGLDQGNIQIYLDLHNPNSLSINILHSNGQSVTKTFVSTIDWSYIQLLSHAYYDASPSFKFNRYDENQQLDRQLHPTGSTMIDTFDDSLMDPRWSSYTDPGITLQEQGTGTLDLNFDSSSILKKWYSGYYSKPLNPYASNLNSISLDVTYDFIPGELGELGIEGYSIENDAPVFFVGLMDTKSSGINDPGRIGGEYYNRRWQTLGSQTSDIQDIYSGSIHIEITQFSDYGIVAQVTHSNGQTITINLSDLQKWDELRIMGRIWAYRYQPEQSIQFDYFEEYRDTGSVPEPSPQPTEFITIWDTTITDSTSSGGNQIQLPLLSTGSYDFMVNWGDGTSNTITTWDQTQTLHTYSTGGIYTITITGTIEGWSFVSRSTEIDSDKLIKISQWGSFAIPVSGIGMFEGCSNMVLNAIDAPDLTKTLYLDRFFKYTDNIGSGATGSLQSWDVSHITTFSSMFYKSYTFNFDITNWDMSSATDLSRMFYLATQFNQDLLAWDVSKVDDMKYMFFNAYIFNGDLSTWDVSSVKDMTYMFAEAFAFNQDISSWDVSQVTDMTAMFSGARSFNIDISSWNVAKVQLMRFMFQRASTFNQNIGNWDVSSVTYMNDMFLDATAFNQDISSWDVSGVVSLQKFLSGTSFSTANYDSLLNAWAQLQLQFNLVLTVDAYYSLAASTARSYIISQFGWSITDLGQI